MTLSIKNLSKTYSNGVEALKNITLDIPVGMFGLLGPNGAGKSTLMRTLATLQEPDTGNVFFDDIDILNDSNALKKQLGYLPQEFSFYPKEKAFDLLEHFAILKGISNKSERKVIVENLLKKVNLWEKRNHKIGSFSGGMKRRFGIAQILLGDPQLIIVDEPTAGLDPEERLRFYNLLSHIGKEIVLILSTHIVEDVSNLCPNLAIINKGEIIFQGDTKEAVDKLTGKIWEKEIAESELENIENQYFLITKKLFAGKINVKIYSDIQPDESFIKSKPTLEDYYFFRLKSLKNN